MSIQQKYNTKAAALYRDKIWTLAQGKPWSEATAFVGQNYSSSIVSSSQKHSNSRSSTNGQRNSVESSKSYQDFSDASSGYQNLNTPEFVDSKQQFFNRIQEENASRPEWVWLFKT